jgi:hypothetical protein
MAVNFTSVMNPVWADSEKTRVNCFVTVEHFGDEIIPFTACSRDIEAHGRELFQEIVDGKHGLIADYIPPDVPQPTVTGANTL